MAFLGLLFHVVLWLPLNYLLSSFAPGNFVAWISIGIVYVLALSMSFCLVYVAHAFNPEWKPFLRNLIRLPGVKLVAFAAAIVASIVIFICISAGNTDVRLFGLLLPVIFISLLNSLGIDKSSAMLADDEAPGKLVSIPPSAPLNILGDISRKISWEHNGRPYSVVLMIRRSVLDEYRAKTRADYAVWAQEYVAKGICGELRLLAHKLLGMGKPYGTLEEVAFVLSFVQQAIKYELEEGEHPRYPLESLADGIGDCEDYTILGAALLKLMGYDVAILFLPGHAALGVAGAEGILGNATPYRESLYYYCEMTGKGWEFGQLPDGYQDAKIEVQPVPSVTVAPVEPKIVTGEGATCSA
jgi:hypothetical protein